METEIKEVKKMEMYLHWLTYEWFYPKRGYIRKKEGVTHRMHSQKWKNWLRNIHNCKIYAKNLSLLPPDLTHPENSSYERASLSKN